MGFLGIPDPGVWLAYVACIAGTLFCIIYGMMNWNKGDERISSEDIQWVKDEKKEDKGI